jgi:hypothetical protein
VKKIVFIVPIVFLLGCGGGGSDSSNGGDTNLLPTSKTVIMVPGQVYLALPGDKLLKTSASAQVKIMHIDGQTRSSVELVSGSAKIILQ